MKRIIATLLLVSITLMGISQVSNPVEWSFEAKKKTADTYEVTITANVPHPWHIYSQNTGKGGPVPTKITFKANPLLSVAPGKAKEVGKLEKIFDKNFQTNVLSFSDKVQFVQTIKVKAKGNIKTNLAGSVEYMVCDDTQCLPPTKKSFDLKLQ